MKSFNKAWLDELAFKDRKLVILHLMRVTLHYVTSSELPMYYNATRDALRKFLSSRSIEIEYPIRLTRLHKAILEFIRKNKPVTTSQIRNFLRQNNLPVENLHRIIHYQLAGSAIIIRCGRKGNKWLWTLMEDWLPHLDLNLMSEGEAKKWLILKYLDAFGPSTIQDIVSWTWHSVRETKSIIEELKHEEAVLPAKITGLDGTYRLLSEDYERLEEIKSDIEHIKSRLHNFIRVLPEFDPLTVGLRKRLRNYLRFPSYKPSARPHPAPGVILAEGEVVATYVTWPRWSIEFTNEKLALAHLNLIIEHVERTATFQGLNELSIWKINGKPVHSNSVRKFVKKFLEAGFILKNNILNKRLNTT